jgi:hypothetical protein
VPRPEFVGALTGDLNSEPETVSVLDAQRHDGHTVLRGDGHGLELAVERRRRRRRQRGVLHERPPHEAQQRLLQLGAVGPGVHLRLQARGVLADEVPDGVTPAGHHEVCARQPQRRAVVAAAVAQVDDARLRGGCGLGLGLGLAEDAVQHEALAHVGRAGADAAAVRRRARVVAGPDAESAVGVDAAGVGVDLGEAGEQAVVVQDGVDEEGVGVAEHAQVAAERVRGPDGGGHARVDGRRPERLGHLGQRPAPRVQLPHHRVHERVPGRGGEEALEQVGEAEAVHHPVVAVHVDDRLVEVEHHHDPGHVWCGFSWLAGYDASCGRP